MVEQGDVGGKYVFEHPAREEPYHDVRFPEVKNILIKFDDNVVSNLQEWPIKKYNGINLVAGFLDEYPYRLHSLFEHMVKTKGMEFENLGKKNRKMHAFSQDQLRVFMLLGLSAYFARGGDVEPSDPYFAGRNKFRKVPESVKYILGENKLKELLLTDMPNDGYVFGTR